MTNDKTLRGKPKTDEAAVQAETQAAAEQADITQDTFKKTPHIQEPNYRKYKVEVGILGAQGRTRGDVGTAKELGLTAERAQVLLKRGSLSVYREQVVPLNEVDEE